MVKLPTKEDQDPYTLRGTLRVRCHCSQTVIVALSSDTMKGKCSRCGSTFKGAFFCFYKERLDDPGPPPEIPDGEDKEARDAVVALFE